MGWKSLYKIKYYIASVWRVELDLKRRLSSDLKPNRIKIYREYLETLILTIAETINPFSLDLNIETLFNIGSGKVASKEATSFLLHVTCIGNRAR